MSLGVIFSYCEIVTTSAAKIFTQQAYLSLFYVDCNQHMRSLAYTKGLIVWHGAIVLYDSLEGLNPKELPLQPDQIYIAIEDLVIRMKHAGFASAIKAIRNNLTHVY